MQTTNNSNVNNHLSASQLQAMAFGRLAADEYGHQVQHIVACEQCHLQLAETLEPEPAVSTFSLESEFWIQHDHLLLRDLTNLADDTIDHESRSISNTHLRSCKRCRESFTGILALREAAQQPEELQDSAIPSLPLKNFFLLNTRITSRVVYLVAAAILIALTVLVSLMRLSQWSKSSAPKTVIAKTTSLDPSRSGSPIESKAAGSPAKENEPLAVLRDGRASVEIYQDGQIKGLEGVSWAASQEVSRLLLTGNFRHPNVLKQLARGRGSLRGTSERSSDFKLIYPTRLIIIDTRPRFRWQGVAGASSYQVFVMNSDGTETARSGVLPPSQLHWTPENSLPRGKLFSWSVIAVIDQTELIAPPPSETEMKFAVLSEKDKKELDDIKRTESHLAKGLFFARTGLLAEAENEFTKLAHLNPQSPIPRRLSKSLREAK